MLVLKRAMPRFGEEPEALRKAKQATASSPGSNKGVGVIRHAGAWIANGGPGTSRIWRAEQNLVSSPLYYCVINLLLLRPDHVERYQFGDASA